MAETHRCSYTTKSSTDKIDYTIHTRQVEHPPLSRPNACMLMVAILGKDDDNRLKIPCAHSLGHTQNLDQYYAIRKRQLHFKLSLIDDVPAGSSAKRVVEDFSRVFKNAQASHRCCEVITVVQIISDRKMVKDGDRQCVICMEEIEMCKSEEKVLWLPCSHVFHETCITKWLHKSRVCPICRYEC